MVKALIVTTITGSVYRLDFESSKWARVSVGENSGLYNRELSGPLMNKTDIFKHGCLYIYQDSCPSEPTLIRTSVVSSITTE